MNTVRIAHPEVGEAVVPVSAVPHWRASGWQIVEDAPTNDDQEDKETPKRRRVKEAENGGA